MPTPRLEIYVNRIESNAHSVIGLCKAHRALVACVSKVLCAHPAILHAFLAAGADMLADSRLSNLKKIADELPAHPVPVMLLRPPTAAEVLEVVRYADVSLNVSLATIKLLSQAAQSLAITHKIILMVDLGDLREGVMPDRLPTLVKGAAQLPNIELSGLGTNMACYAGVIPTTQNMQQLVDLRNACRTTSGLELNLLSGGNSSCLPLLASGGMPREINHFRIGEAILLGRNVLDRSPWLGTRQDTFRIVAEVIEVERKPSLPLGPRGQDAFGNQREFVDRGIRKVAICNLGRQDVPIEGLTPEDKGIIILGGSSDHLLLDVEDAQENIHLGHQIGFLPNYAALLAASTSPYVAKLVVKEDV